MTVAGVFGGFLTVRVAAFVLLLGRQGGGAPRSDRVPAGLCGGTFRSGRGARGAERLRLLLRALAAAGVGGPRRRGASSRRASAAAAAAAGPPAAAGLLTRGAGGDPGPLPLAHHLGGRGGLGWRWRRRRRSPEELQGCRRPQEAHGPHAGQEEAPALLFPGGGRG